MNKSDRIELTRVAFLGAMMVVFLVGLLLAIETSFDNELALIALMAMVILNANFFYHTGQAKKDGDERLATIANRSMANSWYLTLTAFLVLLSFEGFTNIGLSGEQILGIGIMVMIASMTIHYEIVSRREDAVA